MNVRCAKRISIISCDSLYWLADNLLKIRIIKSAVNDALKSFGHDCCKILNIRPVSNLEGLAATICFVFPVCLEVPSGFLCISSVGFYWIPHCLLDVSD